MGSVAISSVSLFSASVSHNVNTLLSITTGPSLSSVKVCCTYMDLQRNDARSCNVLKRECRVPTSTGKPLKNKTTFSSQSNVLICFEACFVFLFLKLVFFLFRIFYVGTRLHNEEGVNE